MKQHHKIKSSYIKLGIYQIAGGAIGPILTFWELFSISDYTEWVLLIHLPLILFFAFSIFCGIQCLKERKEALLLSGINQCLQIIGFSIIGITYSYTAGLYLSVELSYSELPELSFGAGLAKFEITFNDAKDRLFINLNLLAIFLVYWIQRLKNRVKKKVESEQINTIGSH